MTEDVIEFLVKYEFNLMISLDGDKKSHDINRRFKTGKGSFDIILENLSRLKAYNEEYYSKVLFNCVISSSSDLENIYRFYSEEELFEAGTVNFNYVNPVGLKDETLSRITQKNFRVHRLAYIKMILSVLEKRKWDAQSRLLRRELQDMVTKDAYQEVLDRISSKEGSYLQSAYSTSIAGIQNATREGMELAPDEASAPEKMEIKFQKKTEDHGVEAARSWMSTELENTDTEDYFTADVGEDRKAYIEAERYNQEIDNDSSFLWMEGSNFIEEETIETEEMQSEYYSSFGMDTNGYTEKFHELADAYRKCMDKITFTEEDGKEQAEQVLEDLGIDGMGLVDSDRTVWFPNGACSERNGLGLGSDALWQGDLDRGLPGYEVLSKEEYLELKQMYETENQKYQKELSELNHEEQRQRAAVNETKIWLEHFNRRRITVKQLTREALVELVDKIYVYPEQKIDIYFKFASVESSPDRILEKDGVI